MELSEVKSCFFGYKKADVVRYISEMNELHTAELGAKSEQYAELKGSTDNRISVLSSSKEELEKEIASLKKSLDKMSNELKLSIQNCNEISSKYDALFAETRELREKSEVISTAIINAEKCAGKLVEDARENADEMVRSAKERVGVEKEKLIRAGDCVRQARRELKNTLGNIDSMLAESEAELERKTRSVEEAGENLKTQDKGNSKFDISIFKRA